MFDDGTETAERPGKSTSETRCCSRWCCSSLAIAQRFKDHNLRTAVNVIAFTVLVFTLASILTLPA